LNQGQALAYEVLTKLIELLKVYQTEEICLFYMIEKMTNL